MNLADYGAAKLELADILRSIPGVEDSSSSAPLRWAARDLFARLAEDRFNLVVAGRFSRGKTTLINVLLGTDRLPTGILPLTSVITSVAYGSCERVRIELETGAIGFEVPMEQLAEYVTERGNPGNARRVRAARVELPAEILRRGFHIVDTPGLGSAIAENSRTTEAFLPEADAVIVVSGYDGPLTEEELRVVRAVTAAGRPLFFILNKQDLAAPAMQREVEDFARSRLADQVAGCRPQIFSVSALEGLTARMRGDALGYAASGVARLERRLTRFLVEEKRRVLLESLSGRVRSVLDSVDSERREHRLRDRLEQLTRRISGDHASELGEAAANESATQVALDAPAATAGVDACPICARLRGAMFDFFRQYQFDLARRAEERERLAESAGLCGPHLWLYASIAADRDICLALAPLADRFAEILIQTSADARRSLAGSPVDAVAALDETVAACIACATQTEVEAAAIDEVVRQCGSRGAAGFAAPATLPSICLPHLRAMARRKVDYSAVLRPLARRQAIAVARLTEDMRRYALKRDGVRGGLATEEEALAARRAIEFLAGDRLRKD